MEMITLTKWENSEKSFFKKERRKKGKKRKGKKKRRTNKNTKNTRKRKIVPMSGKFRKIF